MSVDRAWTQSFDAGLECCEACGHSARNHFARSNECARSLCDCQHFVAHEMHRLTSVG